MNTIFSFVSGFCSQQDYELEKLQLCSGMTLILKAV